MSIRVMVVGNEQDYPSSPTSPDNSSTTMLKSVELLHAKAAKPEFTNKRPKYVNLLFSLRVKTIVVLSVVIAAMFLAFSIVILSIFPRSFTNLEKNLAAESTKRMTRVLSDEFENINHVLIQYSMWDDTLLVMDGLTSGNGSYNDSAIYLEENFNGAFMTGVQINYALFYFSNGTMAFGNGIDILDGVTELPIPDVLLELSEDHPWIQNSNSTDAVNGGLFEIDGKIFISVSGTIQESLYDPAGRTNGILVFLREIRSENVQDYATRSKMCVQFLNYRNDSDPEVNSIKKQYKHPLPIGVDVTTADWENNKPFLIEPLTKNVRYMSRQCYGNEPTEVIMSKRLAAYALLPDMFGENLAYLITDIDRKVNQLEISSLSVTFSLLFVLAVTVFIVIVLFIEFGVLRHLYRLIRGVKYIAIHNDISKRVDTRTRDEIGVMGRGINDMLDSLEAAQNNLKKQKEESERLLLNMLPEVISNRLKISGAVKDMEERALNDTEDERTADIIGDNNALIADTFPEVSVLFSDMVGFTGLASRMDSTELVRVLNKIFSAFDNVCKSTGVEKIKTIGDAFMAVAGAPVPFEDHADRAVNQGLGMYRALRKINKQLDYSINIRIGINSGSVVAGVIGTTKYVYDIFGDTVNVASRMESHGVPGCIHISEMTYVLLNNNYGFRERGTISVKGKGDMRTYLMDSSEYCMDDLFSSLSSIGEDVDTDTTSTLEPVRIIGPNTGEQINRVHPFPVATEIVLTPEDSAL